MASSTFDRERAIRILVDAAAVGDAATIAKWKISERTLFRYRARMADDPRLAGAVIEKQRALDADWQTARREFLRSAIGKLRSLVEAAGVDRIREVAGAIKIVGDLEVVSGALGDGHVEQLEPDKSRPIATPDGRERQADAGAGEGERVGPTLQ